MSQRKFGWVPPSRDGLFSAVVRSAAAASVARNFVARPAANWRAPQPQPANDAERVRPRLTFEVVDCDLRSPLQLIADAVAIAVLGVGIGLAYNYEMRGWGGATSWISGLGAVQAFAWAGLTVALLFLVLERIGSDRQGVALTNAFDRMRGVARGWSFGFAALLFILFALKASADLSRGFLLSFYLSGLVFLGAWRALTPPLFARLTHKLGYGSGEWVVIGDPSHATLDAFVSELTANKRPAPAVIRFNAHCDDGAWPEEQRQILSRAASAARALQHGAIYLCGGGLSAERLASISHVLSILPVAMYILPDAATTGLVKCKALVVGSRVAVEVRRAPLNWVQLWIKRVLDVVLASVAIIGFSPVLLGIAVAIKCDSEGPVLFRQTRTGLGGKPFRIFKFRTMHVLENGSVIRQACRNDARVTRVGRFLRSKSIDELPQLLNVLKGEMSLVGPRPHAMAHDELYGRTIANYEVRQHVKPGITGWAQVHGLRGETASVERMQQRIEFDIWYAINASLLLDCEILIRTLFEVCRQRNAY